MFGAVASKLVTKMLSKNAVSPKQAPVVNYGLNLLLNEALLFAISLVFGVVTKTVGPNLVFFFTLSLFRRFCGGHHVSSEVLCFINTLLLLLSAALILKFIPTLPIAALAIAVVVLLALLLWLAPVDTPNKPLTLKKRRALKKLLLALSALALAILALFYYVWQSGIPPLALGLFYTFGLVLAGKIQHEMV